MHLLCTLTISHELTEVTKVFLMFDLHLFETIPIITFSMMFCLHLSCLQVTGRRVSPRLHSGVGRVLTDHLSPDLCSETLALEGF